MQEENRDKENEVVTKKQLEERLHQFWLQVSSYIGQQSAHAAVMIGKTDKKIEDFKNSFKTI